MEQSKNGAPFIIWTLQRTGGTNLAKCLIEYSGLLEAARGGAVNGIDIALQEELDAIDEQWKLHEPFNVGNAVKAFSRVTESWISTQDATALEAAMEKICVRQLPMKHCVEMVPWEISAALAKSATRHGYRHLFLYRKNAADRLLSLHYAHLTGIWGTHSKNKNQVDEKIFSGPLPIQELVQHETFCNSQLARAWELLESLGVNPVAIAFEDIYDAPATANARERLLSLVSELDLTRGIVSDRKLVSKIIMWGDQGTKKSYFKFKGIDALKQALKLIPALSFEGRLYPLEVEMLHENNRDFLYAAIDIAPRLIQSGHYFDVAGVVVLKDALPSGSSLYMAKEGVESEIRWGIQSPAMARRFPTGANSANARFKAGAISCSIGKSVEIVLRHPSGECIPVFRLRCGETASQHTDGIQ